jgi:hypothetical protein
MLALVTARVLVGCLLVIGCRPSSAEIQAPDGTGAAGDAPEPDPGAPPTCEGGRTWNGHLDGCMYEHDGCCYDSPHALCAAAGCEAAQCRILEVRPAQARCDESAPQA